MRSPSSGIELGRDHWMKWFVAYGGDPELYTGVTVWHPALPADLRCIEAHDGWCGGAVFFDMPENAGHNRPKWTVQQLEPLTLWPSLGCHCGDHGFIKRGRWVLDWAEPVPGP